VQGEYGKVRSGVSQEHTADGRPDLVHRTDGHVHSDFAEIGGWAANAIRKKGSGCRVSSEG
jgi:hypothetical protein